MTSRTKAKSLSNEIKPYIRADGDVFLVGAQTLRPHDPSPYSDYYGPCARVSVDDDWVTICTDDYEGNAVLNIEALPFLIRALKKLNKRRIERLPSDGSSPKPTPPMTAENPIAGGPVRAIPITIAPVVVAYLEAIRDMPYPPFRKGPFGLGESDIHVRWLRLAQEYATNALNEIAK